MLPTSFLKYKLIQYETKCHLRIINNQHYCDVTSENVTKGIQAVPNNRISLRL